MNDNIREWINLSQGRVVLIFENEEKAKQDNASRNTAHAHALTC